MNNTLDIETEQMMKSVLLVEFKGYWYDGIHELVRRYGIMDSDQRQAFTRVVAKWLRLQDKNMAVIASMIAREAQLRELGSEVTDLLQLEMARKRPSMDFVQALLSTIGDLKYEPAVPLVDSIASMRPRTTEEWRRGALATRALVAIAPEKAKKHFEEHVASVTKLKWSVPVPTIGPLTSLIYDREQLESLLDLASTMSLSNKETLLRLINDPAVSKKPALDSLPEVIAEKWPDFISAGGSYEGRVKLQWPPWKSSAQTGVFVMLGGLLLVLLSRRMGEIPYELSWFVVTGGVLKILGAVLIERRREW